ncbi:DUF2945 domain-containing protein [Bdellovibrio sp. HCB209]|uniref:DUF2945 domain-containing protein n=1 Tax=Bdellovibrio sp. HCB209 TaxID=3394354 RepID=UPI0039B44119
MAKFKKSSKVQWQWLGRPVLGTVEEVFKESVTKTIKGKKITRHGSEEKPAYLVKSEAGNLALKLETELSASKTKASATKQPKMFQ